MKKKHNIDATPEAKLARHLAQSIAHIADALEDPNTDPSLREIYTKQIYVLAKGGELYPPLQVRARERGGALPPLQIKDVDKGST